MIDYSLVDVALEAAIMSRDMKTAVFLENVHRLRRYNHELAMARYFGGETHQMPIRPLLLTETPGGETAYEPSAAPERLLDQNPRPVGGGPDRYGYYTVIGPDYHAIGDVLMTPDGSGYVKVETPLHGGGYEGKWIKVT